MQQISVPTVRSFGYTIAAIVLAATLGLGSGAFMAWLAPSNKFSWAGLAIAPLWFLLEAFFEVTVGVVGHRSKATRISTVVAVLMGFYVAWFALRGVTP